VLQWRYPDFFPISKFLFPNAKKLLYLLTDICSLNSMNVIKTLMKYGLGLCLPVCVCAQTQTIITDSTAQAMDEVMVTTGQYRAQSVKQSVYQVRVITAEQIRRMAPARLQDIFNTQLNIRFSQDLSTGGANINMLGLSGQNVKILLDGMPMTGRQGTSNEININQIEVNSIERIEIVEGPMSVIYGADALAGVINIITKKTTAASYAVDAKVLEESVGKEYGIKQGIHNQYVGASAQYRNWYINGGIGRNLFNGWKDTATGRELIWHKKDQIAGNATVGYRSERLTVFYRLDGLDEIITNPADFPANSTEPAQDQEYMTGRLMQQLQATYRAGDRLFLNTAASYTHFTRQVYATLYYRDGDVRANPAAGAQSTAAFNGFTFRTSAVYQPSAVIAFQPGIDINTEQGNGDRMKAGQQHIEDYAFFLTTEITPNAWLNLRPGVRVIKNSVYDAPPAVPSLNARLALTEKLDLRLAYARGYRAPSLRELYYDFFDASHSIEGNPGLKAEHSNSFTGSVNWRWINRSGLKLNTLFNGFYNKVNNMISFATSPGNAAVTTYLNIDQFKSKGATLTNELLLKELTINLGLGYTGRYNSYVLQDAGLNKYNWSGEVTGLISKNFSKIGLTANLNYKYTGRLPYYQQVTAGNNEELRLVQTNGYHWADCSLNKKLGKWLLLNAGVRNVFDVTAVDNSAVGGGAHSTSGPKPVGYGRSYFLGLVFNWKQ